MLMNTIKYSNINLNGVTSLLINDMLDDDGSIDIIIPDTFLISQQILNNFNARYFTPGNINDILSLCDYLLIVDTQEFINEHIEPSDYSYILNDCHKDHYHIVPESWKHLTMDQVIKNGYLKYIWCCHKHINKDEDDDAIDGDNAIFDDEIESTCNKYTVLACKYGQLKCLKCLHEQNFMLYKSLCTVASWNGHLECLKYCKSIGCLIDSNTCSFALMRDSLDCLIYLIDNGYSLNDDDLMDELYDNDSIKCATYLFDKDMLPTSSPFTCAIFAGHGKLDYLKRAREKEYEWDEDTTTNAGQNGYLKCLKYACSRKCPVSDRLTDYIASSGHLDCLKYMHSIGCKYTNCTCDGACYGGHLDCLKFLHSTGCEWTTQTCTMAAERGHLDCLKFLHENGCPWYDEACIEAGKNGHLDCLKYAHENGCGSNIRFKT